MTDKKYIVSEEKNKSTEKEIYLTPCGKEKKRIYHKNGKYIDLPYCSSRYCYPCRRAKLSPPYTLLLFRNSLYKTGHNLTVRIGGYEAAFHIDEFEDEVSYEAKKSKIKYTFCAGYEQQEGLCNIHYGLFTNNKDDAQRYAEIVRDKANAWFVHTRGEEQVKMTYYPDLLDLYEYVSKYKYEKPELFMMPKWLQPQQFRWRRRYKEFLEN